MAPSARLDSLLFEDSPGAALASLPTTRVCERRRPEGSVLYRVVEEHLETAVLEACARSEHGFGFPAQVERTFRDFINCGRIELGFCRVRCPDCGFERLVAFSCKGPAPK